MVLFERPLEGVVGSEAIRFITKSFGLGSCGNEFYVVPICNRSDVSGFVFSNTKDVGGEEWGGDDRGADLGIYQGSE